MRTETFSGASARSCADSTRWTEKPSSSQQQRVEQRTLTLTGNPRHDLRHGISRPPSTNSRTKVGTPRRARHTAGPYQGQGTCTRTQTDAASKEASVKEVELNPLEAEKTKLMQSHKKF